MAYCDAETHGDVGLLLCTLAPGHAGQHTAHGITGKVYAVWGEPSCICRTACGGPWCAPACTVCGD